MLLIDIIVGQGMAILMGAFATDEHTAARLLLQTLLVDTFRADDEANKVDALVLGEVDLSLETFGCNRLRSDK